MSARLQKNWSGQGVEGTRTQVGGPSWRSWAQAAQHIGSLHPRAASPRLPLKSPKLTFSILGTIITVT